MLSVLEEQVRASVTPAYEALRRYTIARHGFTNTELEALAEGDPAQRARWYAAIEADPQLRRLALRVHAFRWIGGQE